jgi:hypothetical protein
LIFIFLVDSIERLAKDDFVLPVIVSRLIFKAMILVIDVVS